MNIEQYLETINRRYITGIAGEHTYRSDLELLVRELVDSIEVTNEPSQVTDCGNPDYVITKSGVPVGYIEAKDIGKDLNSKSYIEQFTRYRNALDNLIITDYIWFQFFENGELVAEIRIADIQNGSIVPNTAELDKFKDLIVNFTSRVTQAIKSPAKLAELMAGKARLLQKILKDSLDSDIENEIDTELTQQLSTFRTMLIHDLEPKDFSDLYAQTLAYGMFASRYHDKTLENFDRDEAARLIPKSNPLLRNLFQSIAGYNIDERIRPTVDNLAEVFRHADVKSILSGYGKSTQQTDPIVHFYETFLSKYDAKLRKARGVWYTPAPVVKFIVRAVDEILKTKFNLKDGLADMSKTIVELDTFKQDKRRKDGVHKEKKEFHKVQILDPATGTGTFLAEVVQYLYDTRFKNMQGVWPSYVENDLIPRLNGFELLMASYAMAHLKLDMLLGETGCDTEREKRFRIFLTNSLEEYHPDTNTLFSSWLSSEAQEANTVKKDTPIMVVMGNPPYSSSSSNKSDWIQSLLDDYKKDLNERNIQPLSDDYIKFIRLGQYFVDVKGEGVLAFITNNSFVDGLVHRQMRKNLLESFDEIYILNLHGDSNKKEVSPDGSKDENVFDIKQGVSINLFIKTSGNKKRKLGSVYCFDLYGKRDYKYNFLANNSIGSIGWDDISTKHPEFYYKKTNFKLFEKYSKGFMLNDLFKVNSGGIKTHRDNLVIDFDKSHLALKITNFFDDSVDKDVAIKDLKIKETSSWSIAGAREKNSFDDSKIHNICYRPFDIRAIYLDKKLVDRDRSKVMKHMESDNLALLSARTNKTNSVNHFFVTRFYSEMKTAESSNGSYHIPLYLYSSDGLERIANLNTDLVKLFEDALNLSFTIEKQNRANGFSSIDILDFIYAVLHSQNYRSVYKEFLKTDFPYIPYPNIENFWQLVTLGSEIRKLHLMESDLLDGLNTTYPQHGNNTITRKITKNNIGYEPTEDKQGRVWINDEQYFDKVPLLAWEFYIGGYQPAQKWLKDRQGMELSFDDILHYQKIIKSLSETHRLMQEVDNIIKI